MTLDRQRALLRHTRSNLPDGDPVQQINAMIERQDTQDFVENLPGPTLFRLIKQAGFDQGEDLLPYATPEQIQTFIDFDVWRRGKLIPERFHRWMNAVVDGQVKGRFKQVMREVDSEIVALYFKYGLKVELIEEGEIPEHMPMNTERSPDGVYAIVYPDDEIYAVVLRKIVRRLFEEDLPLAWTLLEAVRWELTSEMEEMSYRWRLNRLEEEGFVPRDEAITAYKSVDPQQLKENIRTGAYKPKHQVKTPQTQDLPSVLISELAGDYYILDIIDTLENPQLVQSLIFELSSLNNRTMIADGIEPGEIDSGRQVIRRTLGYISVGLLFLTNENDELAKKLLNDVALRDIFKTGYALASRLQKQAAQLHQRPTLTLTDEHPYSLLNSHEIALMESLTRQRPTFAKSDVAFDIFREQTQIDAAAMVLGQIAFKQLWLFGIQRQSINSLIEVLYAETSLMSPADVTFDVCMATVLAQVLVGNAPTLTPLDRHQVGELLTVIQNKPWLENTSILASLFAQLDPSLAATTLPMLQRWVDQSLSMFEEELGEIGDEETALVIRERLLMKR